MTRYYDKNSKELTLLDKLRLLNGGFHQVNLQLGNPSAKAYEQQQQREQYQQPRQQYRQPRQQLTRKQYEQQQQLIDQVEQCQRLREQFELRRRNRR